MLGEKQVSEMDFPILNDLIDDPRMEPFHNNLQSQRAASKRTRSLRDFSPPKIAPADQLPMRST